MNLEREKKIYHLRTLFHIALSLKKITLIWDQISATTAQQDRA